MGPIAFTKRFTQALLVSAAERFGGLQPRRVFVPFMRSRNRTRRSYEAAKETRLNADLPNSPVSIDQVLRDQLGILRARSRHAAQNDPHMRRFLGMVEAGVVGSEGFQMMPNVRGRDGEEDAVTNAAIEDAWLAWCRPRHCDVTGQLSFPAMQRLFVRTVAGDGEFLARRVRGAGAGPFGYQLSPLDPELLDRRLHKDLPNGNVIFMGIEYDAVGRPVNYYLQSKPRRNGAMFSTGYVSMNHTVVPADQIFHRYATEFVGQKRGIPWASTVLGSMSMLTKYDEAALVNARVAAANVNVIEEGDTRFTGTSEMDGQMEIDIEPGVMPRVAQGTKLHHISSQYPTDQYDPFTTAMVRRIASGLCVSFHGLSGDLTRVNFSSIRQGILDERDVWRILQVWMREAFVRDVYEDWLASALLAGAIRIGGASGPPISATRIEEYKSVNWQPRGWEWVDPKKDAEANALDLGTITRSPQEVIRQRGRKPGDVLREVADFRARAKELGIEVPTVTAVSVDATEGDDDAD